MSSRFVSLEVLKAVVVSALLLVVPSQVLELALASLQHQEQLLS
jgi:hypothetical protein